MKNLPCDIVRDLLPSYTDGLASAATRSAVNAHLASCPACSEAYTAMSAGACNDASAERDNDTAFSSSLGCDLPEIDYMKKIRKKGRRNILLAVLAIVLIFVIGIFLKLFVIGYTVTDFYGTEVELRPAASDSASEKEVVIRGNFFDSATVYSRYKIKENDGIREVIIYGSLPSFVHKSASFEIVLPLDGETQINVNGETIMPDGQRISRLANELYDAKNPYIGDMPANNALAELLSISSRLGSYTNELQTAQAPYSWELKFGDSWKRRIADNSYAYESSLDPFEKLNDKMRSYACVLLALIDNCGEIKWSYTDNKGDTICESLDLDTANEFLEIKDFGRSALDVQKLLEAVGIE